MVTDAVCVSWLAGFAINAAVAFERQLGQMFFPLLSLATIVRSDPYYPSFNASFDRVAKELMDEVGATALAGMCVWLAFERPSWFAAECMGTERCLAAPGVLDSVC
jgi:hypothetical protein